MNHPAKAKQKLLHRARRLQGQFKAVEEALETEQDCSAILLTLSACRGAVDSLMAEIIEGHIRGHIIDRKQQPTAEQQRAAKDVISAVHRYLK